MMQRLVKDVNLLRKKGDYGYVLSKYVNIDFWMNNVRSHFKCLYVQNLTDFNYSTCFTIYMNISDTSAKVGTEQFSDFIKENMYLYCIEFQISAIAPYAIYKFIKYVYDNDEINMIESFSPFLNEHYYFVKEINEFLSVYSLNLLDTELLSIEIPDVTLEMRKSKVTVYHCLFEDEY